MSDTSDTPSDLSRIFGEFLVRRQQGEPQILDEYCERFPDLAEQLRLHVRIYDTLGGAGSQTDVRGSTKDVYDPVAPALDAPRFASDRVPSEDQPQRIGRYRIERILGKGGFGIVYLAHDEQLQRLVVIKVPHQERVERPEDAHACLTEARTIANLDHPNIVPVYDVGCTEQFPCYVVSKFIDGIDLARRLRQARLRPAEIVKLVVTVAEALHHAHKPPHLVVHRDIKPGNILLDRDGEPFVTDFGLALREQDIGKGPRCAGTPAYMSPEQAHGEGHRVDGRSDIFSLGVVFYEMLTGRLPFQGESTPELLEQVSNALARPPRQIDDTIPKELERSCLKALEKRPSDRYATARDMAEDLRHWLSTASADRSTPTSDNHPIKIVPKGLRSFDAQDADFFLELLPGPRDRQGLPDSIRFWKTRIETLGARTFSVGLIYGPSGCGKSSLIRAGLLPRLANFVTAVYVEATGEETEARLLSGLRRQLADLPANLGLIESLAALRQGRFLKGGQKVLLVLDQFEQWLHSKQHDEHTNLVPALRQCDGERVQSIVLVRDDFGMAATRFMAALDLGIVQGDNFATVDLFDLRHARKVLTAFGRAFAALPEHDDELTKEQNAFLDQAVFSLSQENKVVSVRLALFAEMVKGKTWAPATLKEIGGTEGVGVTFLEDTFASRSANPQHRLHQGAAQAVLKSLLPDAGTDIKGHMRSQQELLEASGYVNRPKDFDELLRILDSEIRLITPTDPKGMDEGGRTKDEEKNDQPFSDSSFVLPPSTFRYYQLTHDYLVPSLRNWLTRKQKETRRGRTELLLADRAAVWNARPEIRQLPSFVQWFQIKWLIPTKNWTRPERKMMRQATRYHAARSLVMTVLILIGSGIGLAIRNRVQEQNRADHAAGLVKQLLAAEIDKAPPIIREIKDYRLWANPLLREENDRAGVGSPQKLHASLALSPVDPGQTRFLYDRLLDAEPHEVLVIADALAPHKQELLEKLWSVVEHPRKGKEKQRLRAASALASFDPQSDKWVKYSPGIVNDLVLENSKFLGQWGESFRPVKNSLLEPLYAIFRNRSSERSDERMLATNLLTDYAADRPRVLADLLMDADAKQFARIYPLVEKNKDRCIAELAPTLAKQLEVPKEKIVFESRGVIAENAPKVKPSHAAAMPAKRIEVPLQRGKNYQLTMDSKELESFLVLRDRTGTELAYDRDSGGENNARLLYTPATDNVYSVFAASFKGTGSFQLRIVEMIVGDPKEKLAKRQANAAVALLRMKQEEQVWPLLARSQESDDPRVRSYLIDRFGPFGAEAAAIIKRLEEEQDITVRRALVLSLGEFDAEQLPPHSRHALLPKLRAIYCADADAGLHGAAEWLLRQWDDAAWLKEVNIEWAKGKEAQEKRLEDIKQQRKASRAAPAPQATPQWYLNGQGYTMVVIPDPGKPFMMGAPLAEVGRQLSERQHERRIQRTFALAAKPVTVEQFGKFDDSYKPPAEYTRMADLPAVGTSWYQAAAYCNWLSQQEGIDPMQWCYETIPAGKTGPKVQVVKLRANYLSLSGYRLPTKAEIEYTTRAGAITSRFFGETDDLLPKYAWYVNNSEQKTWPVGKLKPNDFGLFDVQGNVLSWCQERYYRPGGALNDEEDSELLISGTDGRIARGGSFANGPSNVRSAYFTDLGPSYSESYIGFRVARTLPLDH
jgi:serine/threonine protein kinase/formylglycine-generating enzyme required for sulfatase activity